MKNTPYVKKYNENGELLNPIERSYINYFPNRSQRRSDNGVRQFNNRGNRTVYAIGGKKFHVNVQTIVKEGFAPKHIVHYI